MRLTHLFLAMIVFAAHDQSIFLGLFLFFLGMTTIFKKYQSQLTLKEALLVAFFLTGLVVLGNLQKWWLQPLLADMKSGVLFFGTALLTATTDNATLTYLSSQVGSLSGQAKYLIVSGAVCGGGFTVIANAPNPDGYSILNPFFGKEGINPLALLKYALLPTSVALGIFWFFSS